MQNAAHIGQHFFKFFKHLIKPYGLIKTALSAFY